ncbi:MAG TPA: hypothetical protein VEX86_16850 [Longimicrobium sp.]|nr:hypothetical protein [Longimicrobium sp.]
MCKPLGDLDKFYIERTTTALYDAGAAASRSVLLFVALYAVSGLVLFGPVSPEVKIEALGVDLPRSSAGEVLLVLACAALYQHYTLLFTEILLRDRLEEHLTRAGGSESDEWFLRYPSMAHFHGIMAPAISGPTYVVSSVLGSLLMMGAFLFPLLALVQIGRTTHWSADFAATALLCVLLLVSTLLLSARMGQARPEPNPLAQLAARTASTVKLDRAVSRWLCIVGGTLLVLVGSLAERIGWGIRPGIGALQIGAIVLGVCLVGSRLLADGVQMIRGRNGSGQNDHRTPPPA